MKYPEKEEIFKRALRMQILSRSQLVRKELAKGTKFIYSEAYPTQVLNTTLGRFIRINHNDISDRNIHNLLKTLMGIESYVTIPEHEVTDEDGNTTTKPVYLDDINEVLNKAKQKVAETDFVDLNTFDPLNVNRSYDPDKPDEQHEYYYNESDVFNYDSFGNITGTTFNLVPQTVHPKTTKPTEEDEEDYELPEPSEVNESVDEGSSSDITEDVVNSTSMGEENSKTGSREEYKSEEYLEQAIRDMPQHVGKSTFHTGEKFLSKKDLLELQPKVNTLLKAFKGVGGKVKLTTPTKRVSSKDIATDRDKCYVRKTGAKGKHIKLNLLIDMSGSMSGSPMRNAVKLVYLFNQLAKQGYVTMSVLYSSTSANYRLDLPASDSEVLAINRAQSAEGLAKTIEHHKEIIRGVNTICITDGDIVDEAIDKMFWSRNKSVSTGIYVNSRLSSYTEYTGKLNTWFNHSIVRKTLDELIEWLVRTGLKG